MADTKNIGGEEPREGAVRRVWHSVFPGPIVPRTERERRKTILDFFVLHLRPVRVRRSTLPYTHTFGLGGSSAVLISLMVATGTLMMFAYEPTPERAYESVSALQGAFLFGGLVRNIHHWSANLLVAVAFAHMLRVFFTGGFHGSRQFNWVIGVALLAVVLASNFTGYLLPWDQLSYWAVTICTGMFSYVPWIGGWLQQAARGGPELGASTLILYYTLHTTLLPVALVLLMGFHFWRVRKAGGVVDPRPDDAIDEEQPEWVSTLPDLLMRELAAALALVAFVCCLAVAFDAPLGAPANPGMSTNPAKSPWYFVGFQELQLHFHPLVAVVVIPALAAFTLLAIPYLRYPHPQTGPWFLSATGRRTGRIGGCSRPGGHAAADRRRRIPAPTGRGSAVPGGEGAGAAAASGRRRGVFPHPAREEIRRLEIGGGAGGVHPVLRRSGRSDDHRGVVPRSRHGPGLAVEVVR